MVAGLVGGLQEIEVRLESLHDDTEVRARLMARVDL
jgi:hypothetical protein